MLGNENIELVERCKRRDKKAMNEFVQIYQNKIYNICYYILQNTEDARDVTQEVFIKIFNSLKKFEYQSSISTWVYALTRNTAIDYLRKTKKYRNNISFNNVYQTNDEVLLEIPHNSPDPLSQIEAKEIQQKIQDALRQLPEEYRTVIILRDWEGMTYDEIAEVMNCPIGTVRSRIHNATVLLGKILREKI